MFRLITASLALVLALTLIIVPAMAAVDGFSKGVTKAELENKYKDDKVRILIAAGHEPGFGGAVYKGVYEREITVEIAEELESLLKQNPSYEVIVTRDDDSWHRGLQKYFDKNKKKIERFVNAQKKKMTKLLKKEKIKEADDSHGVAAPNDVALRLYGINKWANENKIDLVVNLHVNDAPDHGPEEPSQYRGYAIYVPEDIYGNSKTSAQLAREIEDRLEVLSRASTHPQEEGGIVEHRDFIAVGAYGTLNVPSVLVEYGYITEPRFADVQYRDTLTKDLAYQTYLGLQDFFGDPVADPRSVAILPTEWPRPVIATTTPTTTVALPPPPAATTTPATPPAPTACAAFTKTLALMDEQDPAIEEVKRLQRILAKDEVVYPEGLVTGFFGPATQRAVKRFQEKHQIVSSGTAETTGYGIVGPKTAKKLLELCF